MKASVRVIGAGLAGVEACLQLAKRNVEVDLYEMKPGKMSPAHKLSTFAELVCSNSLRSDSGENAAGLLKMELRLLGSEVMKVADLTRIPSGSALAVDRESFSQALTKAIQSNPLIKIHHEEVTSIPEKGITIIATGPLTSDALSSELEKEFGALMYFYDAVAPIIAFDSIDTNIAYFKNRYDKGDGLYLNCPMSKEQYDLFYEELINAECVPLKEFEMRVFEGCMPIEEMAKRGPKTLTFGPLKPIGLQRPEHPKAYAVVQLRQDNHSGSLYNIVGFQTHLTFSEQKRIIRMIPGLAQAEIIRYGVMHRNTFINAPALLLPTYQLKNREEFFVAGQLSGVEGYVESIASGFVAGINAARLAQGDRPIAFPLETMIGAQANYIANADSAHFQPMNINFGLVPPIINERNKKNNKALVAARSLEKMEKFIEVYQLDQQGNN